MIDLTRKVPKLNTMYKITQADSVDTINCRINFNIIDFIYRSLLQKVDGNKTSYYENLYEFLDIGESYYEKLKNGSKVDVIKQDKSYRNVKINDLITGASKLQINGISQKQWKRYFWMCKKIKDLKKISADKSLIEEAENRKRKFEQVILKRIDNKEMNSLAINIYDKMSKEIFMTSVQKRSIGKADRWIEIIDEICVSDLEIIYSLDKKKYQELRKVIVEKAKAIQIIAQK